MTTAPTGQFGPASRSRSRAKMLAACWLMFLVADVALGLISGALFSWATASSVLLALSGLLTALSLRRHEQGLPHDLAGNAAIAAALLAAAAMVVVVLR